jgi:hypothetical protein
MEQPVGRHWTGTTTTPITAAREKTTRRQPDNRGSLGVRRGEFKETSSSPTPSLVRHSLKTDEEEKGQNMSRALRTGRARVHLWEFPPKVRVPQGV